MAIQTEQIREVQAALAARSPVWSEAGAAITAPNGAPADAAAGFEVQTSTGTSAVYTALAVVKGASVTTYSIRWWAYYAGLGAWCVLDGSAREDLDASWTQLVPTGPVDKLYCEVLDIDDSGTDGLTYRVGPCDPGV